MAFTYDINTDRGKVRFTIGDTVEVEESLTDAEVDYALTQSSDPRRASLICVDALLAKYHRHTDHSGQGINSSRSQKFNQLLDLRKKLKEGLAVYPRYGGTSEARNSTTRSDTDYDRPAFSVGMHDQESKFDPLPKDDTSQ